MSRSRHESKVYCSSALLEKTEYLKQLSFKAEIEDEKLDILELS
jgi:hypothetical protein